MFLLSKKNLEVDDECMCVCKNILVESCYLIDSLNDNRRSAATPIADRCAAECGVLSFQHLVSMNVMYVFMYVCMYVCICINDYHTMAATFNTW